QVRDMFPLPGEHTEQGCNGEGFPPVGWHGECTWGKKAVWHDCVVCPERVAYKVVTGEWVVTKISSLEAVEFRPIRSERERWVEESSKVFHGACMHDYSGQHFALAMGAVYDALKSGDLKAPGVE